MSDTLIIRDAVAGDLAKVESLLVLSYEEYERELPHHVWEAWQLSMRESIYSGNGELLIGECGGHLVAFVHFYPDASESTMDQWPQGSACIRMLSVIPECRGRGYGAALTGECLKRARLRNIPSVYLQTGRIMTAAHRLYEKLGFKRDPRFDERPFGPEDHTFAYRYDVFLRDVEYRGKQKEEKNQ